MSKFMENASKKNKMWTKPAIATISNEVLTQKIQVAACSEYDPHLCIGGYTR